MGLHLRGKILLRLLRGRINRGVMFGDEIEGGIEIVIGGGGEVAGVLYAPANRGNIRRVMPIGSGRQRLGQHEQDIDSAGIGAALARP